MVLEFQEGSHALLAPCDVIIDKAHNACLSKAASSVGSASQRLMRLVGVNGKARGCGKEEKVSNAGGGRGIYSHSEWRFGSPGGLG